MAEPTPFAEDSFVLVVSGPGADRRALVDALKKYGVPEVESVESAIAAFARLAVRRPIAAFVDAGLKPVTAIMLTREVRANPISNRDVPIFLFAKGEVDELVAQARDVGADGVFGGAIDPDDLAAALSQATATVKLSRGDVKVFGRNRAPARPVKAAASPTDAAYVRVERLAMDARACVAAWARNGLEAELAIALTHLNEAAQIALRLEDAALLRCLNKAMSAIDDTRRSWDADHRLILAAIEDAVAACAAPGAKAQTPEPAPARASGLSKVSEL